MRVGGWWKRGAGGARLPVLLVTAAVLSGCFGGAAPRDHYYRLSSGFTEPALRRPLFKGVLAVDRFGAGGLLGQRQLLFTGVDDPLTVTAYDYHLWIEPPAVLFQERLLTFLRRAGVADQVVRVGEHPAPDHLLTGTLRLLERRLGTPVSRGVVELDLGLRRADGGEPMLLKSYRQQRPLADETVSATVKAIDDGVSVILKRFLEDLRVLAAAR